MDKRTYRQCVRTIIVKGDKILLAKGYEHGKLIFYTFPGGGVEDGQTIEEAAAVECLEEVGIAVKNVTRLNVSFKIDCELKADRAELYRGNENIFLMAEFVKVDKRLLNSQNDALAFDWVTIQEAVRLINHGPQSKFNAHRLIALDAVKARLANPNREHYSKGNILSNW